ncbi:RHS repeat domain-containing protein, partial [Citrobacter sedlakii]
GRIQELLTEDGTLVWRGEQQLWGREEGRNREEAPACRLRFPGQYEDEESGLYYNRFRYYDCGTGQYLCADPIGLEGGLNLYQYAPNPFNWSDPLGLSGEPIGSENNPFDSSRAARREAMRQAGIPTNQQPISQSQNSSGREYSYETPKPGGGTGLSSVQEQTMDISHPDKPHWEAGQVKTDDFGNPRMNKYGRPQLRNGKGKAYYGKGGCK